MRGGDPINPISKVSSEAKPTLGLRTDLRRPQATCTVTPTLEPFGEAMRDRGAAKLMVLLLLGVIVAGLVFGCHFVSYEKLTGGRKVCILTKERFGLQSTVITASNELKLAARNPLVAARLASGSGICVDF